MPKINYDKLSIYKFYCLNQSTDEFYIGSTCNFIKKKAIHKRNITEKPTDRLSVLINSNGGWNNWKMECIEELENTSQKEVIERENYWFHLLSPKKKDSCKHTQTISFLKNSFKDLNYEDMKKFLKYANKLYDNVTNQMNNKTTNNTVTNDNDTNDTNDNDTNDNDTNDNNTNDTTEIIYTNDGIQIIPLGSENLHEVLSVEQQVCIIKKFYKSITHLVCTIYKDYPQFCNCIITNLSRNTGYMYDKDTRQFNAHNKNNVLNHLIFEKINDIRNFLENENVIKKLKNSDITKIKDVLDELEDRENDKYKTLQEEIGYILYNKKN